MRMDEECICGSKAKFIIGTTIHKPLGKEIIVHNTPHFHCEYCDTVWFDIETKISEIVVKSYKKNLQEINYN